MPGLEQGQVYYSQIPNFPWGIVLNNTHIYEDDFYKTLAHELGHYLGLFHVFSEKGCDETDYCDDTENYDRTAYTEWLSTFQGDPNDPELFNRTNCETGESARVRHVLENSPLIPGPKNITVTKGLGETDLPVIRIMH